MTTIVNDLRSRLKSVTSEAETIAAAAVRERRDLTEGEASRCDALFADARKLRDRIDELEAGERRAGEFDTSFERVTGQRPVYRSTRSTEATDAIRDIALGRRLEGVTVGAASHESLVRVNEARGLSVGGATAGATTVPKSLYGQIITGMAEGSGLIAAGATILSTDSGEDYVVPVETTPPTATIVPEATAIGGTDPVLGSKVLKAYKYGVLVKVSRELLDDTGVDLEGYLAARCGYAIGAAFGAHVFTGTGVGQPTSILSQGIVAGVTAPTGVTTTFGTQATAGQGTDLFEMLRASVAEPYAQTPTSGFLMRNATASALRRLKDSTGGLVGTQWAADENITLDAFIDPLGVSKKAVMFGDWSRIWVRIAGGFRFERDESYAFNTDEVTFRCLSRMDVVVVDPNGLRYMVTAAS